MTVLVFLEPWPWHPSVSIVAVYYVAFLHLYLEAICTIIFPAVSECGVSARSLHISPNRCCHALHRAGAELVRSGGGQPQGCLRRTLRAQRVRSEFLISSVVTGPLRGEGGYISKR